MIDDTIAELHRIMENIRKTATDTKGAVRVALDACWFDLEKVCHQDMIDLGNTMKRLRENQKDEDGSKI